ncbi:MAG: methylenetetrahydrofolate reductase C-terminal domain-containing protein [Deltaproteobacteria bacterium]|nr:methylenetetrahydrofolate reductase C-terminal domain-containing protein [Deltaproteobacteria bacterium]
MTQECKDKPESPVFSKFRHSLANRAEFTITFELVPSRGGRNRHIDRTLALARDLARDGRIQAVSITDNAGGHPALSPEVLGLEILAMGLDVISHFSCKDKNRNEMESQLFGWDRRGLHNLLVISGDYPKQGYRGHPKPVFDLDSVHVVDMLNLMNKGHYLNQAAHHPTSFFKGVAVSPFKLTEAEQLMQYYKLHRKIAAGADYVITQLGFDAGKYHEILQYMQQHDLSVPLLGSVFIPSLPLIDIMHRGGVPGCIIPDKLHKQMHDEAKSRDQGKKARLTRAAKLMAVLKHIGYDGAHIGGPGLDMADFNFMLDALDNYEHQAADLVEELNFWPPEGFRLYRKDKRTGLNLKETTELGQVHARRHPVYDLARLVHHTAFDPQSPFYGICRKCCLALHDSPLKRPFFAFEHTAKFLLFDCRNCGDCTLASLAYLCPQSGCAKYMLNGPCGGSRDGWCEVYPGKKRCIYVKTYERLASTNNLIDCRKGFEPPRNWRLNNTSAWLNFYLGLDGRAERGTDK